jgi:hypothetical protein
MQRAAEAQADKARLSEAVKAAKEGLRMETERARAVERGRLDAAERCRAEADRRGRLQDKLEATRKQVGAAEVWGSYIGCLL